MKEFENTNCHLIRVQDAEIRTSLGVALRACLMSYLGGRNDKFASVDVNGVAGFQLDAHGL